MLAPAVVRAGVPRTVGRLSATAYRPHGHRRSATSTGSGLPNHLGPSLLPPILRDSLSTSADDAVQSLNYLNTPSSTDSPSTELQFHLPTRASTLSVHPSSPNYPTAYADSYGPTPVVAFPSSPFPPPVPFQSQRANDAGLRANEFSLTFDHPQYEADFNAYLERRRSNSLAVCYTAGLLTLGLMGIIMDGVSISRNEGVDDAIVRIALITPGLGLIGLMTLMRLSTRMRLKAHRMQWLASLGIIVTMTLCSLSWTLTYSGVYGTNKLAVFIVFLQLLMLGRRPLLFPYATFTSTCSTIIYTALMIQFPAPVDTSAALVSHCIVLYIHLIWLIHTHRQLETQQRQQYAETLQVAVLKRENETLDHDTKALKGEFFQLTLERFDIADVEEEGKVLTSAMEQAMGKLQMLGKKRDLPADVLKEIMKVISLLGSGTDLFKAKMEGSDWKNGLYGGDDELTRYIYETLNGEAGASRHTPRIHQHSTPTLPQPNSGRLSTEMQSIDEIHATRTHARTISAFTELDGMRSPMSHNTAVLAHPSSQYDRSLSTLLHQLDDWNLDVFEVATLTQGKPLFFIGMALFKKYGYIDKFDLDKLKVSNFLRELEGGYSKSNPYHNSAHAADVARSVHWFIQCGHMTHYCSEVELFALLIASLAHDFQHPGKNNAYHIAVHDEKAVLYNDRSVLENYHASQTFLLLQNPTLNCNFLSPLTSKDFMHMRKLMVGLILATDLAHSNEFLGRFKNWWTAMEATEVMQGGGGEGVGGGKARVPLQSCGVKKLEDEARTMVMKMALKCADVGHSAKKLHLHEKWTARITEEFYRQGDEERRMNLPISPFMDRRKANLSASQLGFMDWIVLPLYMAWFRFLDPDDKRQKEMRIESRKGVGGEGGDGAGGLGGDEEVTVMEQLRKNREYWRTWQGPVGGEDGGMKEDEVKESGGGDVRYSRQGSLVKLNWMTGPPLSGVGVGEGSSAGGSGGGGGGGVSVTVPMLPVESVTATVTSSVSESEVSLSQRMTATSFT